MVSSKYEIKRILGQEEIQKIWEMESSSNEMLTHFPDHKKWLERSIDEISKGKKVAYGLFIPDLDDITGNISKKMVGVIILKKKDFSKTIELSNIFICEKYRKNNYATYLCEIGEKYCAKNGFSTINVRIPYNSIETINLFLKQGYVIFTNKASHYKNNESMYELTKKISPLYGDDQYDLETLSKWIIKYVYNFQDNLEKFKVESPCENVKYIHFDIDLNKKYVDLNADRNPKGLCILIDQNLDSEDDIKNHVDGENAKKHVIFVIAQKISSEILKYCNNNGIIALDLSSLYRELKPIFAHKPIDLNSEEIVGIIVAIKKEFFEKLIGNENEFIYFKGVSIGKKLAKGHKIFFYCESPDDENEEGIKGYGIIESIDVGNPIEIWSKYQNSSPIFSKDEYERFVENKPSLMAIKVKKLQLVNPVKISLINSWLAYKIDIDDFGHFYVGSRFDSNFMSNVSREIQPKLKRICPNSPRIFISSPVNGLRGERMRLKEMIENELGYFCYISEKGGASHQNRAHVLTELDKSQIVICLINDSLGTKTDCNGEMRYPTEEEFDRSIDMNKYVYLYLKDPSTRDTDTKNFLERIGEYNEGVKRQKFSDIDELLSYVKNDIGGNYGDMLSEKTTIN